MKVVKLITAGLMLVACASCGSGDEAAGDAGNIPAEAKNVHPGKKKFANNCAQCHDIGQVKNGPALAGALQRWNNDIPRLTAYIKNSQEVIKTDPYAAKLYKDWSNMVMPPFTHLSDGEIKDIIDYISESEN